MRWSTVWCCALALLLTGSGTAGARGEQGKVGVRFAALPEGLVVEEVVPGRGADRAGLEVGSLIVAVDGEPVGGTLEAGLSALRGVSGSLVTLEVRRPLSEATTELSVERGVPRSVVRSDLPASVQDFRRATAERGPWAIRRATGTMVADDFGGMASATAVEPGLAEAVSRGPRRGRAALAPLLGLAPDDPPLSGVLGLSLMALGETDVALDMLRRARAAAAPDLRAIAGWRGELGGQVEVRTALARALWETGDRGGAIVETRALAETRAVGRLRADVGLVQREPPTSWRAVLGTEEPVRTVLLDGTPWTSAGRERPVVVSFWASWCQPCMEELPALAALWEARGRDFDVVAVSVEPVDDAPEVVRTAQALDLPFPVAQDAALGRRLGIRALPAVRLEDGAGGLRYADAGYSEAAMQRLSFEVDRALADGGSGSLLAESWGRASPSFGGWETDLSQVVGTVVLDLEGLDEEVQATAELGRRWLRVTEEGGQLRWLHTFSGPVRDVLQQGDEVWVATDEELVLLDLDGGVGHHGKGGWRDLAAGDGGVWAVREDQCAWIARDANGLSIEDRGEGGTAVSRDGDVATAEQLLVGAFALDGGRRLVARRGSREVIVFDGDGAVAVVAELVADSHLSVHDLDGDGIDELVVAIDGMGKGWWTLPLR